MFYIFQPQDLDSVCLYYMHFANEYLKGNFYLHNPQTLLLATMKFIADMGSYAKNKNTFPLVNLTRIY